MPTNAFNPDTAAGLIGASPSTIRNWCKLYSDQLSASANPAAGKERRLTENDVATLQQVAAMRAAGQSTDDIRARLQAAKVGENAAPLTIDVTPTPAPKPQDACSDDLLLSVALSSMVKRVEGIERRLETRERQAMLWTVGIGIWIGMILMGAIFFAMWLAVNGW